VRVHDDVRADALIIEGHIFLADNQAAHTLKKVRVNDVDRMERANLLSVPRGELVSNFGPSGASHEHLHHQLVVVERGEQHLVNHRRDSPLVAAKTESEPSEGTTSNHNRKRQALTGM
jgi:hypothetical protein